ncbi:Protein ASP-7 [Aphelenchoides avenae]|nr:Protein ASP-7 [Aphelenchus avenae]
MKRLVLLAGAVCLTVFALPTPKGNAVVQLPLRRRHQPVLPAFRGPQRSATSLHSGMEHRRRQTLQTDKAQPLVRNFTDSGPFDDFGVFRDEVFTVEVLLGTPAKTFNVTLDYSWWQAFFFSAGNPQHPCTYGAGPPSRRDYIPSESSSAVYDGPFGGIALGAPYVPDSCNTLFTESSVMYNDTLKIGGASFDIAFVYMTDTWGNLDFYWPSDAILGLDRREKGEPTDEYAIYGILGGLPQKVVTVFFDSKEDTSTDLLNGQITFGGIDTQNCASRWDYVPAIPEDGWSVYMTRFSFGQRYSVNQRVRAALTSTSALLAGPPNIVDDMVAQMGAEYDFPSDSFVVPCAKVGTFPDMVFLLGTFEYRLPYKDYIRQVCRPLNGCSLTICRRRNGPVLP